MTERRHDRTVRPESRGPHAVGMTQEEVATLLGLTRERVSQYERRALAKLRKRLDLRRWAEEQGIVGEKQP